METSKESEWGIRSGPVGNPESEVQSLPHFNRQACPFNCKPSFFSQTFTLACWNTFYCHASGDHRQESARHNVPKNVSISASSHAWIGVHLSGISLTDGNIQGLPLLSFLQHSLKCECTNGKLVNKIKMINKCDWNCQKPFCTTLIKIKHSWVEESLSFLVVCKKEPLYTYFSSDKNTYWKAPKSTKK